MILWALTEKGQKAADEYLTARIPALAGGSIQPAQFAMVIGTQGGLQAVVAFHQHDKRAGTLMLTMAANDPRWLTRSNVQALLAYPFEQVGINKLWTWTAGDNERALRVNEWIGLKRQAEIPDQYGPGLSAVICGMTHAEWQKSHWSTSNGKT